MRSLGQRLIVGTILGTTGVLLAAGGLLYVLVEAGLTGQFDRSLVDEARLLAATVEQEGRKIDVELDEWRLSQFAPSEHPSYLQIWRADGTTIFRSESLHQMGLVQFARPIESPDCRRLILPDGRPGRAVGLRFTPRRDGKGPVHTDDEDEHDEAGDHEEPGHASVSQPMATESITLVLARDRLAMDRTLGQLRMLLGIVGLGGVAVSVVLLRSVVHRGLAPLGRLAGEIGRLDEHDLATRFDILNAPLELQPVAAGLNELLGRLESAFHRERGFTADVAHELRTPLAGIRLTMEVALSKGRSAEELQESLDQCQDAMVDMQAMVENLLMLARLESGRVELRVEPVFPNELLRECWGVFTPTADQRRLNVNWDLGPDVAVATDAAQLELLVRNVLQNAVVHADEGGQVTIQTSPREEGVEIRVTNSGSRLPRDGIEQAFQRFWRGDTARTHAGAHAGLGLSLVERIASVLGAKITATSSLDGLFEIRIWLAGTET